jgi:hypothetical protein
MKLLCRCDVPFSKVARASYAHAYVQGDVSFDVEEMLSAPKGKDVPILKGIPEDNIELIEEKKKKSAPEV